ncbi:MAG: hypothetical protein ACRDT9_15675 [Agromyces sp.]
MKRRLASLALAGVVGAALAGCSAPPGEPPPTPSQFPADAVGDDPIPGNGLWLLGGDAAASEIVDATGSAGPVTYSGTFTELTAGAAGAEPAPGRSLAVRFSGRADQYTATIDAGALSLEIVTVDGRSYLRGNAAYAARTGIPELERGFVCTAGDSLLEEWAPFLKPRDLVDELLDASGTVTVQAPQDDAETLDVVVGTAEAPAGVMTVQRTGPPLPAAFTAGDATGTGSFAFTSWGEPVAVVAPADPVLDCD